MISEWSLSANLIYIALTSTIHLYCCIKLVSSKNIRVIAAHWCLKDNLESPAKFFPGLKKAIFNDFQERQRLCTVCSNLGSRNLSWWIRGHRVPLNGQNNSIIRQIFVYDTEVFINIYSGTQLFYSNMKKAHTWQYIPSKIPWKIKKAGPS